METSMSSARNLTGTVPLVAAAVLLAACRSVDASYEPEPAPPAPAPQPPLVSTLDTSLQLAPGGAYLPLGSITGGAS